MKENRNSSSFGLETEMKNVKISTSRKGTQATDIDIVAITEWLEAKSKNGNFFEALRGLALVIKSTSGLEDILDEEIAKAEKSFNEKSLDDKDNEYVKAVCDIVGETEMMSEFIDELDIDIEDMESCSKSNVMVSTQEYIKLKQLEQSQSNKQKEDKQVKIQTANPIHQEAVNSNTTSQSGEANEMVHTFVKHYNNHKVKVGE
jgi:hypothetical protein